MANPLQLVSLNPEVEAAASQFCAMTRRSYVRHIDLDDRDRVALGYILGLLRQVKGSMASLSRAVEIVLWKVNMTVYKNWQDGKTESWHDSWKPLSHQGSVSFNKGTKEHDMGNYPYTTAMTLCAMMDSRAREQLDWLALWYPSLNIEAHELTDHAISMRGDLVEICLAAFHAHDFFKAELQTHQLVSLIDLSTMLKNLCKLVHDLNAYFDTGYVNYKDEYVRKLSWGKHALPSFVRLWREFPKQAALLTALFKHPV
jgi:hypothetical protein